MTRKLRLSIGDHTFIAELHVEEAPETCGAILAALPIEGKVIQARWSGEAVWFPMDEFGIEAPQGNATIHPSRGDLLYYPGEKNYCIKGTFTSLNRLLIRGPKNVRRFSRPGVDKLLDKGHARA